MLQQPPLSASNPIFKSLNILKINDILKIHSLIFAHKYYKNSLPKAFDNYFSTISEVHSIDTRLSRYGFALPRVRTNYMIRSPSYKTIFFWNTLDSAYYDLSFNRFKKEIKLMLINNYINNINYNFFIMVKTAQVLSFHS